MTRSSRIFAALGALSLLAGCSVPPPASTGDDWAGPQGTWQEVFRDDFEGPAGSAPDSASWNETVNGKPDNGELEYYTNRPSNLALDGAGNLVIQAQSEHYAYATGLTSTQPYTSGRLNTQGHVQPQYGRIEARIKLPKGKGLWPAFWLLGQNIDQVGWPDCGEVDILEMRGSSPSSISGSMHGPNYSGTAALSVDYGLPSGSFADDFHVFALEWTADGMRWLVDEHVFHSRTKQGMADIGKTWVFDQPVFIILNLAVGGFFDGDPDSATVFPSQMLVDYVKVSKLVPN
jgi:beta-glucanase (GH16 family)